METQTQPAVVLLALSPINPQLSTGFAVFMLSLSAVEPRTCVDSGILTGSLNASRGSQIST